LRYFYTPFDPDNIEDTKKPFHMVYSPDGKQLLTKGLGGLFPHHRGIFFGYNKCRVGDEVYDVWHAAKGEHQLHKAFLDKAVGPVLGSHTSRILWNDRQGKPFADEKRTLTVYRQPADQLLIEFNATLQATDGKVILEGDRQHAGVQWRSAQEVAENQKKTRYLRPAKWADLPPEQQINTEAHRDLPWNAIQYPLGKSEYTVAYLTSPKNPDNAAFSERLYGRFGEYFPCELEPGKPLVVRYRWWVIATHDVKRDQIELKYADLSNPPEVKLVSAPEK
jgi:hypothetical protein